MAIRIVVYLLWLAVLGVMTWQLPFLFELALAGAIAGAYWLFFRRVVPDSP
ncbi:MAG: hypothetical protein LWW83_15925 [Azonexaceae bacterium]|uniref:hypothetical protein n=1 Tax=Azonexus sp. R2A61 TaxID=2744443 RepID=UPI001F22D7EC|nr:hypothetical protein [Azonexus sp. R2A61]MCE1241402.1 hypothetical protein [Azonexaceae bacterium]